MLNLAEYVWLDGSKPVQGLRSKTRVLNFNEQKQLAITDFPEWSFDGSSTEQAVGNDSDCILNPVRFVKDPIRGAGNYIVLCEVLNSDKTPHISNSRAKLRAVLEAGGAAQEAWFGFEQEYTLIKNDKPLGWPEAGYPEPQGPYYCAVGAGNVDGRTIVEEHMKACLDAGLMLYGINAEVMLGQWEFQIGYRGVKEESADALTTSDHTWIGRWLLDRISEDYGISVSYHPKPVTGDWNGSGCHTNFSTIGMRDPKTGMETINSAIGKLEKNHQKHIDNYGSNNDMRLVGAYETCHISEFRAGNSDRGASIRIPVSVYKEGYGYMEDRRPASNCDPYIVSRLLIETVCDIHLPSETLDFKTAVNG